MPVPIIDFFFFYLAILEGAFPTTLPLRHMQKDLKLSLSMSDQLEQPLLVSIKTIKLVPLWSYWRCFFLAVGLEVTIQTAAVIQLRQQRRHLFFSANVNVDSTS